LSERLVYRGNEPLIGVKLAAEFLGIHPNSLYRLVDKGEILHYRIPGVGIRFSQKDLARWVEGYVRGASKMEICPPEIYDDLRVMISSSLKGGQSQWTVHKDGGIVMALSFRGKLKEEVKGFISNFRWKSGASGEW
jgi:excisionase family DNA binding protein